MSNFWRTDESALQDSLRASASEDKEPTITSNSQRRMRPARFTSGTRNVRSGEERAPAPSSHPPGHSTAGEPSFTVSEEVALRPSLLLPSATGEPCSWSPEAFYLYTACCPQITLKSPTRGITETLGTSRAPCPNSAGSSILGSFLTRVYLTRS